MIAQHIFVSVVSAVLTFSLLRLAQHVGYVRGYKQGVMAEHMRTKAVAFADRFDWNRVRKL